MAQYNSITYGFKVGAPIAIDDRLVLTLEQMRSINDDRMPDTYFAVCKEDGKFYLYNKLNSIDATYGKFRVVDQGNIRDVQLNGTSYVDSTTNIANITVPFELNDDGLLCCKYIAS